MRLWNKLASRRGETLTETLVAILVVALSSAILATMIGAASRMNKTAMEKDAQLYGAVTAAETKTTEVTEETPQVEVTVGSKTVTFGTDGTGTIEYYSDVSDNENGTLYSYRYTKGGGGS
ncbi:MAG: hypothetical protein Q4C76_06780 [Bacillota bacterium]|nr:hypothetical protein [Bacillota bacterium]